MGLTEIPRGSAVFIDANIFVYHFAGRSDECSALLRRVEAGDVEGWTGPVTLLEVAHRLMMLEAQAEGRSGQGGRAAFFSRHPRRVQRLSRYYFSVLAIERFGVRVAPLPSDFITASQEFRQAYGLPVNDSLIPMHMRATGISILASSDAAFDRVRGITRFGPADL